MSLRLDTIDAQIVELLQHDGRMMLKDIASKIGVSIPTVRARISRLTELGLIKKFTIVVDFEKIWGRVRVFIIAKMPHTHIEEIKSKLNEVDEIRKAYFVTGERQILLEVELDDLAELNSFIGNKLNLGIGLSDISSFVVTGVMREEYGSPVKPNVSLRFRCDFCGALIYGKPIIEFIDGGRYYFSGEECARAFRERMAAKKTK